MKPVRNSWADMKNCTLKVNPVRAGISNGLNRIVNCKMITVIYKNDNSDGSIFHRNLISFIAAIMERRN